MGSPTETEVCALALKYPSAAHIPRITGLVPQEDTTPRGKFLFSPWTIVRLKRNWKQCLCKIWGDKQKVLWYFPEWPIDESQMVPFLVLYDIRILKGGQRKMNDNHILLTWEVY